MARGRGGSTKGKEREDEEHNYAEDVDEEPPSINPYKVLGLETEATADDVKKAYRKKALLHHPDKVPESDKASANKKFQEIAFAYAILSDDRRRKRYDLTGSTSETLEDDDDFDWMSFYRQQFEDVVNEETIKRIALEYKGSNQERDDILDAYTKYKGKFTKIYESVMLSDILEDDDRFRQIIDEEIEKGTVDSFPAYEKENNDEAREKAKAKEVARREAFEKEYGSTKEATDKAKAKQNKGKKKGDAEYGDMGSLAAMIQKRQKGRMAGGQDFFANLEAKYAPKARGTKRGTPMDDGPTEEEFLAAQSKLGSRTKKTNGRAARKTVVDDDDDEDEEDMDLDSEAEESEGEEEDDDTPPPPKRAKRTTKTRGRAKA